MAKIRGWLTKILAVVAGTFMFVLTAFVDWLGSDLLEYHLRGAGRWASAASNFGLVVDYERVGWVVDRFYPVAVGITTIFLFWCGIPNQKYRTLLYLLIFAIIGPLTFMNYAASDQWLNLWVQSVFNIFVAFVGYVAVLQVRRVQAVSADALALQSLSILLITSLLIALPLFYTSIFLAVAFHLTDHKGIGMISEKIPLAVAGVAGLVVTLLSNLEALRKKPVG